MNTPKIGQQYMHFKGKGPYTILAIARDCEDPPRELVVYRAEYDSKDFSSGTVWVRELSDFTGNKTLDDGQTVPRFTLIK